MWQPFCHDAFSLRVNARLAVRAHANPELHGRAAHLSIFDVILPTHWRVDGDLKRLPAVRAGKRRGAHRLDGPEGLLAEVPIVSFRLFLLLHGALGFFLYVLPRIS